MRGFVFTLGTKKKYPKRSLHFNLRELPQIIRRYGTAVFFTLIFAIGMLVGSLSAKEADASMLLNLDFLFTTNLDQRLQQPMFSTFAASFASNFLFLFFVILCGLAPWGIGFMWISPAFKGFGTGLSAGYLLITYGIKGIGFYLVVMLVGTFISSFALIIACIHAHYLSCKVAHSTFTGSENPQPLCMYTKSFMLRSLYMLLLSAVASVADMLLWTAFSGLFFS